jgi:hypothetical protein
MKGRYIMSTISKELLSAVFVASRNEGKSRAIVVAAVKACNPDWTKDGALRDTYKAGQVVTELNLKSEIAALAIMALKPHKDGASDGCRTFGQQLAVKHATAKWSDIRKLCGAPSAQTGGQRKPKATKVNEPKDGKVVVSDLPAIVKAKSVADVHAYALRMAANVTKFINASPKFVVGDIGDVLRSFVTDVAKAAKA